MYCGEGRVGVVVQHHATQCRCEDHVPRPKKVFLVRAKMLYEDYLVSCTNRGVEPERIDITNKWGNGFLAEYRLSQRCPNRKFKVARWVLAERLRVFWIVVHSVSQLILLVFGYDPMM